MKTITALLFFVSVNVFAFDINAAKNMADKTIQKAKPITEACKKEQVEYCKNFKDLAPLKECLEKNREKLSAECKGALGL